MSSIGSIGGNAATTAMQGMGRHNSARMAEQLFSRLDTSGQGYLQKSDLQAAFDKIAAGVASSSSSSTSGSTASVDDLFSTLDGDGDGKVTKQEFTDGLKQLAAQLDDQFQSLRMSGAMPGAGGTPPPPPDGNDAGFTKDELTAQLQEIGSADDKRASLISNIVANFDKADTDGDGKVSFKEAMAYDHANPAASSSGASSSSASGSGGTVSSSSDTSAKLVQQIMRLMQAYGVGGPGGSAVGAALSLTA